MHYANGREAKVGDAVIYRDSNGLAATGIVAKAIPSNDTCNLIVVPVTQQLWFTAKECLHVDDVFPEAKTD